MASGGSRMNQAEARYKFRSGLALAAYIVVLVFGVTFGLEAATPVRIALMLGTTLPFFWLAWEFQIYVRSLDEMQSLIEMRSAAIGFGLTLLMATFWGFGETFDILPDLSPVFVMPVAAMTHGLVRFIENRRLG